MAEAPKSPPDFWEKIHYRGRPFFHFNLKGRHGQEAPFSAPCRIADRYAVHDVVARGGGGVIFAATDEATNNSVLVKGLAQYDMRRYDLTEPLEEMVESVRRARHHLQTERRLLVQLRNGGCNSVPHPNDYVFDCNPALRGPYWTDAQEKWTFDDDPILQSEPFLVMEQVAGMNLKDILGDVFKNGLEPPLALRIIDQVARVIELLQVPLAMPKGQVWSLVYQDLKPGNVLVDRYGQATVLDFGGCQLTIDDTLVLHGSHSPGYCAPECGRDEELPLDRSADCYGLGSTLYHMLSGINPRKLLPDNLERGDRRAIQIDTNTLRGRCSADVVNLVARCVNWNRAERFQSAQEFRQALAPLLA